MKIGYARVSTKDQSLESQIDALQDAGCERIYQEKASGKSTNRPEYSRMLGDLREGDVVLVTKLDRISRSVRDLISLSDTLNGMGVDLVSLRDDVDTTTASGRLFFNMMAVLAEFERDLLVERTKAGLEAARARGRNGGRPRVDVDAVKVAIDMHETGCFKVSDILKATGIGKTTLYKYLNDPALRAEVMKEARLK